MKKLKIVMIGAGGRANQVIYPSFADLRDSGKIEIAGICDIDLKKLNTTADKYNIEKRYGAGGVSDYQNMINELKPDAVVVIGQPHIMYDIWMWCLEHGLHLYIEKPLALSIHQARALQVIAKRNNCVTQVSLQRRYTPMVMQMRDECLKKSAITHAFCKFYKCEVNKDFLGARDHMMDDCVHSIDTLRWICGVDSEVVKIESTAKRIGTADINFISAVLHFDNGAIGHLINSWSSGKRIFAVEMHSQGIFAEAEHETRGYIYSDGNLNGIEYDAQKSAGSDKFHVYTGVLNAAKDFVDCCINGGQPSSCFDDAVKTMKIAEIILAQSLLSE
ncbi:MAG: Gfo/Idh/MocA family oxidoreductase [Oscillospiraceae bacterium]|nr:Gfo/Idh/MocA family oxidoreductase [Oscillospiraceae bacterium]